MDNLEIEVKFFLEDPAAIRAAIVDLGGRSRGRIFESNHILDKPGVALFRKGALLRLRQADGALLTFKAPPETPDREFKVRREIEVQVSDFTGTRQIMAALGFTTMRIYEKWRETFILGDTHLCLDTLPYGDFLEIEGGAESIRNLSQKLGFAWEQRSVLNYHELFELVQEACQLDFADITFANFEGLAIDFSRLKTRFESGE